MIHGLTPSLAEGGKIKIGGLSKKKTASGHRLPEKHDYFTITTNQRDAAGDLIPHVEIMAALGDKPTEIPIVLHSDEVDEVFPTRYARYSGRSLSCSGDGQEATDKHGEVIPCPCPHLAARRCKPNGTLYCSIALEGHAVAGSVHKWRTTSIISIKQMIGSLLHIRQTVGVLQGVPLILRVGPIQVNPDGKPTTVYVCWIELRAADLNAVQQHALEAAQQRREVRAALNAPAPTEYRELVAASESTPDPDDGPEFYPEPEAEPEPEPEIPEDIPEPQEHPREMVLRIGKANGLTKKKIGALVKTLDVPKNADNWTTEHVAMIRDAMEETTP